MSIEQTASLVPIWPHFVNPTLEVMMSGDTISRRSIISKTLDAIGLTDEARAETLETGGSRAEGRVGWSITHLNKASLIERVARAQYRITPEGRAWLAENPQGVVDFADAHQKFAKFWPHTGKVSEVTPTDPVLDAADETVDPIEQIERGVTRVKAELVDDLLNRIRNSDPAFFEQAVVDVLLAMGYGGVEQRGKRIGGSGDGGVDGVIDQDALGLDQIYVQAKRYGEGNNVGREAIQAFIGALAGFGASRGVFITSSTFTQHAKDYAQSIPTRVILVDGNRLAELMIKYRVGVQIKQTYDIVELDEDFFE